MILEQSFKKLLNLNIAGFCNQRCHLEILKDGDYSDVYLEGDTRIIYTGKLWEDAWKG